MEIQEGVNAEMERSRWQGASSVAASRDSIQRGVVSVVIGSLPENRGRSLLIHKLPSRLMDCVLLARIQHHLPAC